MMKTVPVVNPNISALPLIIKPWHKATVRWSVAEELYICTFEGPGYKKLLFKSATKQVSSKLKELGFTQYVISSGTSKGVRKNFTHVRISSSDNTICWRWKYMEKKCLPISFRGDK